MSTLKHRAMALFQKKPCAENRYLAFNDTYGCVVLYPPAHLNLTIEQAREVYPEYNAFIEYCLECNRKIKEAYGEHHFNGEEGFFIGAYLQARLGMRN